MYADDLCVLISSWCITNLQEILDAMHPFGIVSGLKSTLGKSALVLKGTFLPQEAQYFDNSGLPTRNCVKYLGVCIGNISVGQTFSKVLGEAQRRAALVASLGLSLKERVLLLKTWVLPVLLLIATAHRVTEQEERSLKIVFNTALGFDS